MGFLLMGIVAVVGVQIILSTRERAIYGFIMPALFLAFATYYHFDSPRVEDYITVGIIGFGISIGVLLVSRLVLKYKAKSVRDV